MSIVLLEGLIGAGKTTAAKLVAQEFDYKLYLEPVKTNPYLDSFYRDPRRWAYAMQTHLLMHRYAMQQSSAWESLLGNGSVIDRSLPGDRVFAKLHYQAGNMSREEWGTYTYAYDIMASNLRVPTVMVYLDVPPERALHRIQCRGRPSESGISLDYLSRLRDGYLGLLDEIQEGCNAWSQGLQVRTVDWSQDNQSIEKILRVIRPLCGVAPPRNVRSVPNTEQLSINL